MPTLFDADESGSAAQLTNLSGWGGSCEVGEAYNRGCGARATQGNGSVRGRAGATPATRMSLMSSSTPS